MVVGSYQLSLTALEIPISHARLGFCWSQKLKHAAVACGLNMLSL